MNKLYVTIVQYSHAADKLEHDEIRSAIKIPPRVRISASQIANCEAILNIGKNCEAISEKLGS